MRTLLAVIILLAAMALPGVAAADKAQLDALIDRMVQGGPASWDAALSEQSALVDQDLVNRVMVRCLENASRGDVVGARGYAVLADHVEWVKGGRKKYLGRDQLYLGRALASRNNEPAAVELAEGLSRTHPECPAGPMLRGIVCMRQKDWPKAVEFLKKAVALDTSSSESMLYLGAAYFYAKNMPEAKAQFEAVLKLDPSNKEAQNLLAIMTHEDKAYISKVPDALEHFNKAEELFQAGRYQESLPEYEAAAKADPKFAKPYIYMGDAWWALGDVDKTVASYKKAIEIDPTDPQAYRFMGDVYEKIYDKMGDVRYLDLAIESYDKAVKIDPTYQIAANDLARAQEKRARANTKVPPK